MHLRKWYLPLLLFFALLEVVSGGSSLVLGQSRLDSSKLLSLIREEGHTPAKAALIAAVIPSGGQVYNKKYWKIPIAATGYAGTGFYFAYNQSSYSKARENYFAETDTIAATVNLSGRTQQQLLQDIDNFRRNRDMAVLIVLAWHGLCILDANVDAHLMDWNVSEDLSIRLRPDFWITDPRRRGAGLHLSFILK